MSSSPSGAPVGPVSLPVPEVHRVRRGDLVLTVRDFIPREPALDAAPILLLHGWPQDGRSWDAVVPHLLAAGHRVVVPDLRGSRPESAPRWRWSYRASALIADVAAILDVVGEPVHVVGHDWGAALAWWVACDRPERCRSLTAVSVPHPGAFLSAVATTAQVRDSWYMAAFQVPVLPELLLGDPRRVAGMLRSAGQSSTVAARDAARLVDRRVRRGGLGWYRAMAFGSPGLLRARTTVPVLQIWSDGDIAVREESNRRAERYAAGGFRMEVLAGVSHWIPDEVPQRLAELVLDHVGRTQVAA